MNKKQNKIIKTSCLILTFVFFVALFGFEIYVIFKYPDVTKTRFFLMFWKQYLILSLGVAFSYTMYGYISDKELKNLINNRK